MLMLYSPLHSYWNSKANSLVFSYTLKTFGFELKGGYETVDQNIHFCGPTVLLVALVFR